MLNKVVSRKMEKVLHNNHGLNDCCLFNINPLPQSYCCKLYMNQQSSEHQLINTLNNACVKFILCIHVKVMLCMKCNIWHCNIQRTSPNIIITQFYLTSLLELMTVLLQYINLFVLCGEYIFQHEYCTFNHQLQNILELEPHLLSHTLAAKLRYDCNF